VAGLADVGLRWCSLHRSNSRRFEVHNAHSSVGPRSCGRHTDPCISLLRPQRANCSRHPAGNCFSHSTTRDPLALARQVPGFGGFYLDEQGNPVVYLKSSSQRANAERALAPFFQHQRVPASQLRVLPAQYDWGQLESWHLRVSAEVLSIQGTVFVDADEASNRVTVGLERGALARARGAIARLGIPQDAVIFQEAEPIRMVATLRSKVRPAVGGLQINFPGFLCSLGFNAIRSGQRSLITASHCTNVQGGVEATPYYQPTETAASAKIATEVSDPAYSQSKPGCPSGFRCRFSDASRAAYTAGTTSTLGRIAKTTGPNNNSITINGSFSINAEGVASVGQSVGKVGRTTGWTSGKVTNTCVNLAVSDTKITQLCQNIVKARVGAGDSGAPVFKGSGNVTLVGLLWGGNNNGTQFIYSPMAGIERELGALTTF
jgi:hypothetical protein